MRVAVVGGGVSGLAAAYRLTQLGASATVYEASDRLGGVIRSERRGGYLMEGGPDCFLEKGGIVELCRELGLEDQLIRVRPRARRSFIVRGKRLLPIPDGLYLMAPSAIWPFLRSPVMSWPGKARMLLDLALPPRKASEDESLASFVRRRLGREALERLAQPLLGGIYGADPERLSLAATMPQFLEMERQHGSVIRGLLARRQRASGARYGLFLTFRDGMQTLTDALASRLTDVRRQAQVTSILQQQGGWKVATGDDSCQVDGVCLAAPLPSLAPLLPELPPMAYSSAATLNFGFRQGTLPEGAGFVIPQVERRTIMACTFSSQKFDGRAQEGRILVRAFAGGMLNREAYGLSDAGLIEGALRDLAELLGLREEPEEVWLSRHPSSMPQYEVGHAGVPEEPSRLTLAGNAYQGVGVPDCIGSGFAAASRLYESLPNS
jgi:oxygen-dependent protoporphyrinogen oxidase